MTIKTINFPESTSRNQTQKIKIPNLKTVANVTVNTGNVTYTISGNEITLTLSNGAYTRYTQSSEPVTDSKYVTSSATGDLGCPSSVGYNSGGYSGTLGLDSCTYVDGGTSSQGYYQGSYSGYVYKTTYQTVTTYYYAYNVTIDFTEYLPTLLTPNGGETVDKTFVISWTAPSDPDVVASSLQYNVQLSSDNGVNWRDIAVLTSAGTTSLTYDFTNETESYLCKVRVRSYDSTGYGSFDESDGVFSIVHNTAPLQPNNLSPSGQAINRQLVTRLSWKHNDSGDQSAFELHWKLRGAGTWNTITQNTINQYYDFSANTFPLGEIDWEVKTTDNGGLTSPYSNTATFTSSEPSNAPTITAPTGTVAIKRPNIQWVSTDQKAYQLIIKDAAANIVWDAGEITSVNKAVTCGIDLLNGATYTIELRTKNTAGLWTDYGRTTINISYTPPSKPSAIIYEGSGHLVIEIGNASPVGTEPNLVANEIYKLIDGVYTKVSDGSFYIYQDYQVKSGETHSYFVRAVGDNGTFADSGIVSGTVSFSGVWLHNINDPLETIYNFKKDVKRANSWELESAKLKFKGRKRLVIETDQMTEEQINITLVVDSSEFDRLEQIVKSQEITCYRDGRGRKINGVFTNFNVSDEVNGLFTVDLTLHDIDYKEGE